MTLQPGIVYLKPVITYSPMVVTTHVYGQLSCAGCGALLWIPGCELSMRWEHTCPHVYESGRLLPFPRACGGGWEHTCPHPYEPGR